MAETRRANYHGNPSGGYRRDIDGLRAVAITTVVLFHAGVWPIRSGYVGVDVFFVISGFLIGGIIYRGAATGSFSFAAFYARRARRILPMLFAVVFVSLAAGLALLTSSELKRLAESAVSAMAAGSNFYFWQTQMYFSQDAHLDPMLMTWTLGVEEQFYLTFPVILLIACRFHERAHLLVLAALTLGSLALSVAVTASAPEASFYLLPTRSWELGAGAMLAVWQSQGHQGPARVVGNVLSLAGLAAIGLAVTVFDETTVYPGAAALLPVLGSTALIASEGSWVNRKILAHPVPVAVGLISYSWYLWHWPLMAFARICSVRPPSVWVLSVVALLALVLAAGSWRFVEQPFRRSARSAGNTILIYTLASGSLIVVSIGLRLSDGLPQRLSPEVARIAAEVSATHHNHCMSYGSIPKTSSLCMSTDPGQPVVAIIGDSHAGALAPGLQELARKNGWGVNVFAKPQCRPLLGVTVWRRDQPGLAVDCARFMDAAFSRVANNANVVAVMLVGLWIGPLDNPPDEERYYDPVHSDAGNSGPELLTMGLDRAVRELTTAGKRVFLVGDFPYWPFDPARRATTEAIPLRAAVERLIEGRRIPNAIKARNASSDVARRIVSNVAAKTGARFLDVPAALCPRGSCRYREGDVIFFADQSHVTKEGAIRALTPWVRVLFSSTRAASALPPKEFEERLRSSKSEDK
ncbi:MAG: acyltransferase family protein [Arenicellales bacterium]